jgi:hypothetical protein
MIGYVTITNGSIMGDLTDNLYKLIQWFSDLPAYWIVGGVILFFLLVKIFVKMV